MLFRSLQSKTLLYPEIAYPTYLVGGLIAQIKVNAVGFDASNWPSAELAWINSHPIQLAESQLIKN